MFYIAIKMLIGARTKYIGLLLGIAFTAFLITFALSYFSGFLTRGFALISENPTADIWVMNRAVNSTEMTINIPNSSLEIVRGVEGVEYAVPLSISDVTAIFANGRFQTFHIIGVDDVTLAGASQPKDNIPIEILHTPQSIIVDSGGTIDKLLTPVNSEDQWAFDGVHLNVPMRNLRVSDELLINGKRVIVKGISSSNPRFPPKPLIYTTISNVKRINPLGNRIITFILVRAQKDISLKALSKRIERQTGLRARTQDEFKKDTVMWFLLNSEDVGDMFSMVALAMLVGFGVTGIMLYMLTYENLKHYAVLKAIGASNNMIIKMVFTQAGVSALIGYGLGIGLCTIINEIVITTGYPFRMMYFALILSFLGVFLISVIVSLISIRPILKLDPAVVFSS